MIRIHFSTVSLKYLSIITHSSIALQHGGTVYRKNCLIILKILLVVSEPRLFLRQSSYPQHYAANEHDIRDVLTITEAYICLQINSLYLRSLPLQCSFRDPPRGIYLVTVSLLGHNAWHSQLKRRAVCFAHSLQWVQSEVSYLQRKQHSGSVSGG